MEKVDVFSPRCRCHRRIEKAAEYVLADVKAAFSGRCPECGVWLFKMVKLRKTA